MEYKISSAVCTGRYHRDQGIPCQDAVSVFRGDSAVCAALADGAGSRASSDIGAVCVTRVAAELFGTRFEELWAMEEHELTGYLIEECLQELARQEPPIYEMASTLLFFAGHRDGRFLAGHLGDGVQIEVPGDEMPPAVVSFPENGDYQNETFFLTGEDAETHLRLRRGTLQSAGVLLLMSDGAAESLYQRRTGQPAKACVTISRWLAEGDEAVVSQALEDNLERVFSRHSGDDLSLAAVAWRDPESSV